MRRATLPSGRAVVGSDQVRFHAARALLSDVLVNRDLAPSVRRALKKVSELINPDNESRSNSSELLHLPTPPNYSFPHCGDSISVNEDEEMHRGESIFDWTSVSNVMGLPQISEGCSKTADPASRPVKLRQDNDAGGDGQPPTVSSIAVADVASVVCNDPKEESSSSSSSVAATPVIIKVNSGCVYRTDEISNDRLLAAIDSWRFPILTFSQRSYGTVLSKVAFKAFDKTNLLNTFRINLQKFFNFFHAIENGYHDLPYHNRVHASDVLHACYYLTTRWLPAFVNAANGLQTLISPLDMMALFTAAAIHDHDHPGRNNAFMVATKDPKAVVYNDRSVLENHHVSSAWQILMREENFFIENLSANDQKRFRHYVIDTVLATDLKYHYDLLMNFTDRVSRRSLEMTQDSDSLALGRMILKLADVNSATKPAGVHQFWTDKILEEFFDQGDEERKLGLPVSNFMDRGTCNTAELQRSFMNHVVSPLLNALYQADLLPVEQKTGRCELLENFAENLRHWHELAENGTVESTNTTSTSPPPRKLSAGGSK